MLAVAGLALLLQACAATHAVESPTTVAPAAAPAEVEVAKQATTEQATAQQAEAQKAAADDAEEAVAEKSADQPSTPSSEPEPELTLNLPGSQSADCNCGVQVKVTPSLLEKGFAALAARDYREAVNYFRRYQRLEASPGVDWEANIAVAYVKMIPESPYYNWRAARDTYQRLMRDVPQGVTLHEQIVLYRDTLAILINLHTQINDLQSESAALSESLEKREEALRRLRELTLGQKATAP
jgi:tetratricopeptide (TPR) repeat protein